jgi:hypothetical protein
MKEEGHGKEGKIWKAFSVQLTDKCRSMKFIYTQWAESIKCGLMAQFHQKRY